MTEPQADYDEAYLDKYILGGNTSASAAPSAPPSPAERVVNVGNVGVVALPKAPKRNLDANAASDDQPYDDAYLDNFILNKPAATTASAQEKPQQQTKTSAPVASAKQQESQGFFDRVRGWYDEYRQFLQPTKEELAYRSISNRESRDGRPEDFNKSLAGIKYQDPVGLINDTRPSGKDAFNTVANISRVGLPLVVGLATANPAAAFAAGAGAESLVGAAERGLGYSGEEPYQNILRRITRSGASEFLGQGLGNVAGKTTQILRPRNLVREKVRSEVMAAAGQAEKPAGQRFLDTLAGRTSEKPLNTPEIARRKKIIEQGGYQPTLGGVTGSEFAGQLERVAAQDAITAARFNDLNNFNAGQLEAQRAAAQEAIGPNLPGSELGSRIRFHYDRSAYLNKQAQDAVLDFNKAISKISPDKLSSEEAVIAHKVARDKYIKTKLEAMKSRARGNFEGSFDTIGDFGFSIRTSIDALKKETNVTPLRMSELSAVKSGAQKMLDTLENEGVISTVKLPNGQSAKVTKYIDARNFQQSLSTIGKAIQYPGSVLGPNVSPSLEDAFAKRVFKAVMEDFDINIARGEAKGIDVASLKKARDTFKSDMEEINAFKDYAKELTLDKLRPEQVANKLAKTWGPAEIKKFVGVMSDAAPLETEALRAAVTRDIFAKAYDISPITGDMIPNPEKFYKTYALEKDRINALVGPKVAPKMAELATRMRQLARDQKANASQVYLKKPIDDIVDYALTHGDADRVRSSMKQLYAMDAPLASAVQRRFVQKLLQDTDVTGKVGFPSGAKISSVIAKGRNQELLDAVLLSDKTKVGKMDDLLAQAQFIKESEGRRFGSQTNPLDQTQKLTAIALNLAMGNAAPAKERIAKMLSNRAVSRMISTPEGIQTVLDVLPFPKNRSSFINAAVNYADLYLNLGLLHDEQQTSGE